MTEQPFLVLPDGRLAYTIPQLVRVVPYGEDTLRTAYRKTRDDGKFPPPLRAKGGRKDTGRRVVILATDVQAWLERLPDY